MSKPNGYLNFEADVLPHLNAAYNLARWLTRNEQDAEDVVQEVSLRAFRFFGGFRGGNTKAWLLRIVRNTCHSWLERNRPLQPIVEFDETVLCSDASATNPEKTLLRNEDRKRIRFALEALPPSFREVLILRELEGMSYKEISEVTSRPRGTIMSRLSRARSELRVSLANLAYADAEPNAAVRSGQIWFNKSKALRR